MKNMHKHVNLVLVVTAVFAGSALISTAQAADEAKAIQTFKSAKCTECHGLSSAKIDPPKAEPGEKEAPDPSKLPADVLKKSDPVDFLTGFLQKKEEINGKKHKKKFKGSDDDLKNLVQYLVDSSKKKSK